MYFFSHVTSLLSASPLCVQRETGGKVNKQNENKSQYQDMPIQQQQPNTYTSNVPIILMQTEQM
jgi:hypothetical protein